MRSACSMKMKNKIESKLNDAFAPDYIDVENESHMHSVPSNSETHFKVVLVSSNFEGNSPVKRHQSVYKVLHAEIKEIHALALHTFTQREWIQSDKDFTSPECAGKQ